MDQETQSKLFEQIRARRFGEVHYGVLGSASTSPGFVVEAHGGRMYVKSEEAGQGATFTVELGAAAELRLSRPRGGRGHRSVLPEGCARAPRRRARGPPRPAQGLEAAARASAGPVAAVQGAGRPPRDAVLLGCRGAARAGGRSTNRRSRGVAVASGGGELGKLRGEPVQKRSLDEMCGTGLRRRHPLRQAPVSTGWYPIGVGTRTCSRPSGARPAGLKSSSTDCRRTHDITSGRPTSSRAYLPSLSFLPRGQRVFSNYYSAGRRPCPRSPAAASPALSGSAAKASTRTCGPKDGSQSSSR